MRFLPRAALTLFAALALSLPTSAQTTWYVDVTKNPPGSGTEADPFTSIQAALDHPPLASWDTISVARGTYTETLRFGPEVVHVISQDGPQLTTIEVPAPNETLVSFEGTSMWITTLEGFTLLGDGTSWGVYTPYSKAGKIKRCVVRGHMLGAFNYYDLIVEECTITGNQDGLHHVGGGHGADALTFIYSSIFWDNQNDLTGWDLWGWSFTFTDSLIGQDPLFVNGPTDCSLSAGSPAIDAGDPTSQDPDGSTLDQGALPYDPSWPVGISYCTPTENSTSQRGRLSVSGSASLGAGDLLISADRLPPLQPVVFLHGSARGLRPIGNGFLCSSGPHVRLTVDFLTSSGEADFLYDAANPPAGVSALTPGETKHLQLWYRDPAAAPSTHNLTNAIEVTFLP